MSTHPLVLLLRFHLSNNIWNCHTVGDVISRKVPGLIPCLFAWTTNVGFQLVNQFPPTVPEHTGLA